MNTTATNHFVFVDFENVQEIDLRLIAQKPVHVTLLIGKNQSKLDFELVDQIHRLGAQVELVKLESSGRNALDLTLAFYLGRSAQRNPGAQFCVVSKDKDFEPMISYLAGQSLAVVRCDSFAALPFLPKAKKTSTAKAAGSGKAGSLEKSATEIAASPPDERLAKLVNRLRNDLTPRPKKNSSLLAHINTAFGGKLSAFDQEQKLNELIKQKVLSIAASGKVSYH